MSRMISDLEGYFGNFIPERDELLRQLEQEAEAEHIPIVGPVVGELLFILARISAARNILELGTASGYSAIYLARGCEPLKGQVTTLELDGAMAKRAQGNFVKAGVADRVAVHLGQALDLLPTFAGPFDLIFLDIDKESYLHVLPFCYHLLKVGGLLIADNVGFAGADPFNRQIFGLRQFRTVHLLGFLPRHSPEHDALSLAVKVS